MGEQETGGVVASLEVVGGYKREGGILVVAVNQDYGNDVYVNLFQKLRILTAGGGQDAVYLTGYELRHTVIERGRIFHCINDYRSVSATSALGDYSACHLSEVGVREGGEKEPDGARFLPPQALRHKAWRVVAAPGFGLYFFGGFRGNPVLFGVAAEHPGNRAYRDSKPLRH